MEETPRYALVTGGNKGIGFAICRQLASRGVVVILTCRNEERGIQARRKLDSENVVFHPLDVADPLSIAAAVDFITTKYQRLDILVNNAAITGTEVEGDTQVLQEALEADLAVFTSGGKAEAVKVMKAKGKIIESLEGAEECIQTNYYGLKTLTQALTPLLQQSDSPRIVNVSSTTGSLMFLSNEWAKGVLSNEEGLTEERIDEVVHRFLNHFKEGSLEVNNWPRHAAAYKVSKAALNAYTRIAAKKHPRMRINSVCPGYARTDINYNLGDISSEEAAQVVVKLALLPDHGPSGSFFDVFHRQEVLSLY